MKRYVALRALLSHAHHLIWCQVKGTSMMSCWKLETWKMRRSSTLCRHGSSNRDTNSTLHILMLVSYNRSAVALMYRWFIIDTDSMRWWHFWHPTTQNHLLSIWWPCLSLWNKLFLGWNVKRKKKVMWLDRRLWGGSSASHFLNDAANSKLWRHCFLMQWIDWINDQTYLASSS